MRISPTGKTRGTHKVTAAHHQARTATPKPRRSPTSPQPHPAQSTQPARYAIAPASAIRNHRNLRVEPGLPGCSSAANQRPLPTRHQRQNRHITHPTQHPNSTKIPTPKTTPPTPTNTASITLFHASGPLATQIVLHRSTPKHTAKMSRAPLPLDLTHGVSRSVRTLKKNLMLDDSCREGGKIQNPRGNTSRRIFFTVLTLPTLPPSRRERFNSGDIP